MLELKYCGDLVLREKSAPVECATPLAGGLSPKATGGGFSPDILRTLNAMAEIMESEKGVGLAAPQVGVLQRMLVIKCKIGNDREPTLYKIINPIITEKSEELVELEEGCLSVQDDSGPVFANVTRPKSVTVEWMDETGAPHSKRLTGLPARVFQHEIDHLDGILFIDYLSPMRRNMVMRKVNKRK